MEAQRVQVAAMHAEVEARSAELAASGRDSEERVAELTAQIASVRLAGSEELAVLRERLAEQERAADSLQDVQAQLTLHQNHLHDTEAELRELREEKAQWEQDREFLHQEISGLHSELQAQDETLVKAGREHADTHAALVETRARAEADRGRIQSMRGSASWKLTLPMRLAGRAATGRRPTGHADAGAGGEAAPASAAEMAQRSGGYIFQLDAPADWNLPAQQTRLRGWCLPPAGRRLPALRVRCGDRTINLRCDVPRPDVQAAHGGHPEWHLCGFDAKIDVPGGPSQLSIEAVDEQGKGWLVGHYKVRAPYAAWARHGAVGGNPAEDYATWIDYYDALSAEDRRRIRALARDLPYRPVISVVMPVYNTPEKWLAKAIDSVRRQLYPFWELCIADDLLAQAVTCGKSSRGTSGWTRASRSVTGKRTATFRRRPTRRWNWPRGNSSRCSTTTTNWPSTHSTPWRWSCGTIPRRTCSTATRTR